MKNRTPLSEYENQKEKYERLFSSYNKKYNLVSRIRLLIFLLGITASIYFFYNNQYITGLITVAGLLAVFVTLIILHSSIDNARNVYSKVIEINKHSIKRLTGKWNDFTEKGDEFVDHSHPYSFDMDLFGEGSLFQMTNVTNTYYGKLALGRSLQELPGSVSGIIEKQQAVVELAEKLDWRQMFEAIGLINKKSTGNDPEKLVAWCEQASNVISSPITKKMLRALPYLTITGCILAWGAGLISMLVPFFLIITQILIYRIKKKKTDPILTTALDQRALITTFQKFFLHVEQTGFKTDHLKTIQNDLSNRNNKKASSRIRELETICSRISVRHSSAHPIFNALLLWDIRCLFALEKWKSDSGSVFRSWLQVIGNLEALSSLAILRFNNPGWCMPSFSDKPYHFTAIETGHPLIHEQERKNNDLSFEGSGKLIMITGSNMSGKSTMLRTIGINLVLAYAGSPVCAKNFTCSLMNIYSSMRTFDNVTNNVSSFYAELLRIKMILKALDNERSILYILDEIFKGTNSRDRKKGAIAVINRLSEAGVTGIVSTHDLELTELEKDPDLNIENYYFKETYKNGTIVFDYTMRKGVSGTSDVQYLMKMIGLEID